MSRKHADAGPSYLGSAIPCPASVTKARGVSSPPTASSLEGSAIHLISECELTGQTVADVVTIDGVEVEITDEMREVAAAYVRYANNLREDSDLFLVEARLSLDWFFDPEPAPEPFDGTSDLIAYNEASRVLTVADLKGGVKYVEVEDNPQPMAYGLMALDEVAQMGLSMPTHVRLVIVQPRGGGDPIREKIVTIGELLEWATGTLVPALKRIADDDETENPGDAQCRWCKRNGECESFRNKAIADVRAAFDADDPVAEADKLSNEELAHIIDRADVVETWIKAVRAVLSRRVDLGERVPGWKLVEKRANRKWSSEDAVAAKFEEIMGDDAFEPRAVLSPAKMEKALKKFGADPKMIGPFVTRESSGTTLVRESDARPAITAKAGVAMFDD